MAKAVRTGKEAVLRHVVKAGQAVLGPYTPGVSNIPPFLTTCARTAKPRLGRRLQVSLNSVSMILHSTFHFECNSELVILHSALQCIQLYFFVFLDL